jgi:hypothetical protein
MNTGNPSGTYVGGGGTATDDTASTSVDPGTYYLQIIRRSGMGSYVLACGAASLTGISAYPLKPATMALGSFPNPSRTLTTIRYFVPQAGAVVLSLFDARGKLVAIPVDCRMSTGVFRCQLNTSPFPAGHYLLHLQTNGRTETSIMRIIK